jgi:hypothetical protein
LFAAYTVITMIDLQKVWLPQLLAHAQLVADTDLLREAWVNKDFSRTSVVDLSELFEQVFGDSASEEMLQRAKTELGDQQFLRSAERFLSSLLQLEEMYGGADPQTALGSKEWGTAREAADELVREAAAVGYRAGD